MGMDDVYLSGDASSGASSTGLTSADHIRELSPVEEADRGSAETTGTTPPPSESGSTCNSAEPSDSGTSSTGTRPKLPVAPLHPAPILNEKLTESCFDYLCVCVCVDQLQHSPGGVNHRRWSRSGVSKSNSMASGLSLVIPLDEGFRSAQSPGGGSSTA